MSTQTGIKPDEKLSAFFGKCRDGRFRLLKIVIENERLVLDKHIEAKGSWDRDWDKMVLSSCEGGVPCYLLYRLDEREAGNFKWVMISWSPDSASIRNKMLYASTKATLKKEFGGGQIKEELYANVLEDVSFEGYRKHLVSAAAPGPLSREELEREEVKQAQINAAVAIDTKKQLVTGLAFPVTNAVMNSSTELKDKRLDYVQLSIDVANEVVNLEEKARLNNGAGDLKARVPSGAPRYHVFLFRHMHEGRPLESYVFIYTMPGGTIKERMLYSSCKSAVVERVEGLGIDVAKKIEVDDAEDLTPEFLYTELHPPQNLNRPKFSKPAPPSRGGRRIIK